MKLDVSAFFVLFLLLLNIRTDPCLALHVGMLITFFKDSIIRLTSLNCSSLCHFPSGMGQSVRGTKITFKICKDIQLLAFTMSITTALGKMSRNLQSLS